MTTIGNHKDVIKELLDDINEKLRSDLVVDRQKIIGFATSEASTNLFALFLHKKHLISEGFSVNHRYFASQKRAEQRFTSDFPKKKELITLLVKQETYSDKLCYGKTKEKNLVMEAINNLFKIKEIIESEIGGIL